MLKSIDTKLKLKIMYVYIFIVEIPLGLMMLITPDLFISLLGMPAQDSVIYGVAASVWLAFGVLSILGFRDPLKFVPILLFQFVYKIIWFTAIILPLVIQGLLLPHGVLMSIIFASYVVGDIIVIPWDHVLKKQE